MTLALYFLRRALRGIAEAPFVNAVAALTIAIALFVALIVGGVLSEAQSMVGAWAESVSVTAYLGLGAQAADAAAVAKAARAAVPDAQVLTVSPEAALARLRRSLGEDAVVLEGLEENPLPYSVEVRAPSLRLPEAAHALARKLSSLDAVESVDTGREWAERIERVLALLSLLGQVVGGLILLAAAIMVSNTIKLALYARRDEIEIMKLCGATDTFVRVPFLIEGFLQGLCGALLAGLMAAGLWGLVVPDLSAVLRESFAVSFDPAPPWALAGWLLLAGGLLGLMGSAISLGRFLRAAA